jgi:hypothetical protein
LREWLGSLDIDALTPRDALEILYEFTREADPFSGRLPFSLRWDRQF